MGDPAKATEHPFTLVIEYEHEHHKSDPNGLTCPKVEVHFVVEPVNFHIDSIECSTEELDKAKEQDLVRSFEFGSRHNDIV